jgi:ubiquinone/menaquinone biosynthesis C-methylase UbiE
MDVQPDHPRERELLLLAVQAGADPTVRTRLEQLLAEDIDWTNLVRLAIQHRLVPLLNASLLPIGVPRVPHDITQALGVWSDRNRDHHQLNAHAVAEISAALQGHGSDAVFLSGPALARLAYGNLQLQQAVSPAVLLRAQDLDSFHAVLTAHGYQPQPAHAVSATASPAADNACHRAYSRVEDDSLIEAHTAVVPAAHGITLDVDALRERAVNYDVAGTPVRTPSPEDLVLVLCVTGGLREWTVVGELCDVAWLLHSHPEIDLRQVRARARAQGVERLLLLGLRLAQQALGLSIDAAITDDPRVQRIMPEFSARLLAEHASEPRRMTTARRQLQLRDRFSDRLRYAVRSLLTACRAGLAGRKQQADTPTAMTATTRNKTHWSTRSDAWEKWSEMTRTRSAEFSRALITVAGVASGQRALDLACGVGDTSLELSAVVGPGGFVMTTDLAFAMVARARRRAAADELTNLHFCTAAMESLPFGDRCFDGIVCRLGIMYCPRVQRALAEARRVLRPGARAAFLVCGPREDNPILKIVHEVVTDLFELEKRDAVIDPFRFAATGSLGAEMAQAGFLEIAEQDVTLTQRAPVGTHFWRPSLERGMSLPLEDVPGDTRCELEQRMTVAFEPYLQGEFYELPSLSRITRGTCPE